MIERETIIVGGGPAGSSAALGLRQAGRDCLVLDRATFPRDKLCAGWITPEVLEDLAFTPADYPHRFLTFEAMQVNIFGLRLSLHSPQHSIRRVEFDDWLLQRSTAQVHTHRVRAITRVADGFVIDDRYHCRYLIGAGGTRCPVYRQLFRPAQPRVPGLQAVVLELEYPCVWEDPRCHLWFLSDGLPGYAWYVPKANGYLNIGVGGMAAKLQRRGDDIRRHWTLLTARLLDRGLIREVPPERPGGYSYYLRASAAPPAAIDGAFAVGDSAGLATRDMCEGIGPAVRSGLWAAGVIAGRARPVAEPAAVPATAAPAMISPFTSDNALIARGLEWCFAGRSAA